MRPVGAEDAVAYRELRLEALEQAPQAFGGSLEEERPRPLEHTAARLSAPGVTVLGAFDGDRLVGTAGLRREPNAKERHKAFVFGVYVTPTARGKGVARAMLRALVTEAREGGLRRLRLAVNADNREALSLYGSLGFAAYGREPEALFVDGAYHDEVWMTLDLSRFD